MAYDGTAASSGTGYVDTASIAGSPQAAAPPPPPATGALTSNVVPYRLAPAPTFTAFPYVEMSNLALNPVTGTFVFSALYSNSHPVLIEFDPANPTGATTAPIGFGIYSLAFDAAGHLWTNDASASQLHCFSGITATPSTIVVSDSEANLYEPQIYAIDGSGNVWKYSGFG